MLPLHAPSHAFPAVNAVEVA